jgi:hypothetical protein
VYKIDFAKQLDEGTGGVVIKGKVVFILTPKHVVSEPGAQKKFDFWSQFIAVEDKTGSMGANITFGEEEEKKTNGDIVEVKGTIHKYEAINKKTGEKEEKIVLNSAKVVEPEKPKEEVKQEIKEGGILEQINTEMTAKEIRKEAVAIAFAYGDKDVIADCFNLAKLIVSYIISGKLEGEKPSSEPKKQDKKTKEKEIKKEKTKVKSEKTVKDLEELFKAGQEIGLSTWVELVEFAVEKEVFPKGTTIEVARPKLLANFEGCYDSLIDFIDIGKSVKDLPEGEQPTGEIPF